ncbi:MAG: Chaperone protein DnaJ [Patescibacteria group bacterium]|nr:Chaperone protein DnaJ [Patescibacteria group bacterium]
MSKDFYKILGVEKNASEADIKAAFRKLAHQHHPDKNGGDDKKFKEVNEAYQTLSDKTKRSQYDQFGSNGPQFGGQGGGNPFDGGAGGFDFGGFDFSQFQGGAGGFEFDLGDLFGGGGRSRAKRGNDIETQIRITFKESVFGVEKTIAMNKVSTCKTCHGTGGKPGTKMNECKNCHGQGRIQKMQRTILGNMQTVVECDVCHGSGKVPEVKCETCRGAGVVRDREEILVKIPAGLNTGDTLRMDGAGEATAHGQSGDLFIQVAIEPHPVFKRLGNDLMMPYEINLADALLGKEIEIETLDGSEKLHIPEGTNNGDQLKIKGRGVVHGRNRGDLIVGMKVKMPKKLSRKARELVEELRNEL